MQQSDTMEVSQSQGVGDNEQVGGGSGDYQIYQLDTLGLIRELRTKRNQVTSLQQKCNTLENTLNRERLAIENERKEWGSFQTDMLLVVRAADNYRTDAMKTVEKYHAENAQLRQRISTLEAMLGCSTNRQTAPPAASSVGNFSVATAEIEDELASHKRSNKRDAAFPTGYDRNLVTADAQDTHMSIPSTVPSEDKENVALSEMFVQQPLKRFNGIPSTSTNVGSNNHNNNNTSENASLQGIHGPTSLTTYMKMSGGSKRNALLRWCQARTAGYRHVDITNFSTSWSDGMALSALLHSYFPQKLDYNSLKPDCSKENFEIAFKVAESAKIPSSLTIGDMVSNDYPSWEKVMNYIWEIYLKLENQNCD